MGDVTVNHIIFRVVTVNKRGRRNPKGPSFRDVTVNNNIFSVRGGNPYIKIYNRIIVTVTT